MKITEQKLRKIIRESISSKLNEAYADVIGSGDPVQEILQWAEEGNRVTVAGKNIWPGLGNRSGLHSYGDEIIRKKWTKSGDRFAKKVEALPVGTEVELKRYKNINRDRGKWVTAGTVTIVATSATAPKGEQPSRKVLKRIYDVMGFVLDRRIGASDISAISLYTGSDNPFGRGKVWQVTYRNGDDYFFQDDPNTSEFAEKVDGEWDYLGF